MNKCVHINGTMYRKVLPESTEYQSLPRKVHQHVLTVLATWVSDTASLEPRNWVPDSQQGKAIIPLKEKNGAVNNQNFLILLNKLHFYLKNFLLRVFQVQVDSIVNSTKDLREKKPIHHDYCRGEPVITFLGKPDKDITS